MFERVELSVEFQKIVLVPCLNKQAVFDATDARPRKTDARAFCRDIEQRTSLRAFDFVVRNHHVARAENKFGGNVDIG